MRGLGLALLAGCTVITDIDSLSSQKGDAGMPDAASDTMPPACSNALFCASFDSVATPSDTWTSSFGFPVAFDTVNFLSSPRALGVTVPATTSGKPRSGLNKTLPNAVTTIDVDVAVRIDAQSLSGLNDMDILFVTLGNDAGASNNYLYGINPNDTAAHVYQQRVVMNTETKTQFDQIELPPLMKWFHLHVRIDNASSNNRTVTVAYDGRTITSLAALSVPVDPGISIDLGVSIVNVPTQPWHIEFDDVVVRGS